MSGATGGRTATAVLVGLAVIVAGFLAGRAVSGDDPAAEGPLPAKISTQQVSVDVPTLGEARRIPALDLPDPPATVETESASSPEPEYTPSVEPAPESPAPAPSPSPPEVTVAPSG